MFQNKNRAKEAGQEATRQAVRGGANAEVASRTGRVVEQRTQRELDKWTKDNVGLD